MKSLESRVDAIEKSLGITPPLPIVGPKPSTTTTSKADEQKHSPVAAAASDSVSSRDIQKTTYYVGPGR